ncbi:MAG TPA: hypothetical protein VGX23_34750 [Actinocrinis sp.]|nr:hypothetical protein [Actinocrinis sp.]
MPKFSHSGPAAAAAAVLEIAAGASSASAAAAPRTADTLTVNSATGPNVAVGDVISAALSGSSTLSTSAGNVTCTAGSIGAEALTNTATTATETVTSFTFTASSCTSGITGTTSVSSIGLKSGTAPVATVTASTSKPTVTPIVAVVLTTIFGPVSCHYSGAASGALSNPAHSLAFSAVSVARQTGSSSLCPASGTFTATFKPVLHTTQAGGDVYVN